MADYTVRIVAETDDADRKVKRLDQHLKHVSEDRKINIQIPSLDDTINSIKSLGNALKTTYTIARQMPVVGGKIQDVEDLGDVALNSAKKVVAAGKLIASATPSNIVSGGVSGSLSAVNQLAKNTAELGYTVFGVTQSVNVLKAAFGSFFDDTIGREIRLQEALLRTKTTLVSTTDIAVNGKRITDPYEAILKLEGPIEATLESIRMRSLDIAGTTSDAIIQVFGVVASQIGNIGGSLKDAEDLAITFSAALGTLGLSDPFYATQEIRSILTGTIDQNSILARSLGLTNEEVTKAKSSADGLVNFLQKRLAAFTAGQSLAAKGFAGITSNIQEFSEEIKRSFGKGFLAPLLEGLTVVYTRLQLIFKKSVGIADAVGKTGGAIARGFVGAAAAAPTLQGFSQRKMLGASEKGEKYAVSAFLQIQSAVDKLRPQIASLVDQAVKGLAQLSGGFVRLLEGFANFKFEQFKIYLSALTTLGQVLNTTVIPAFNALMRVYGEILKNPIGQWFTQLSTTMGLLERVGVMPLARTLFLLTKIVPSVLETFKQLGRAFDWVKVRLAGLVDFIVTGFSMAVSAASTAIITLGETLINVVQLGVNKFLLALQAAAGQLGVFLVELGTTIQQVYPKFGQLAVGISTVGKAIIGIVPALEKARLGYAEFALSAIDSLSKLQVKTEQVKQGVVSLGERIKGAIGGAAGNFVKSLKDMAVGLIVFQAQMLLLQAAIGIVTKVISDWQRKQQEISDQTRAELAVKRLSTVYAEVGENATAATKAAQNFEQTIVNSRVDSLTKQLGELSEKMQEVADLGKSKGTWNFFRAAAFAINPSNLFDKRQMKALEEGPKGTNIFDAYVKVKRDEIAKLSQELERLTKFQDKQKLNEKATEDVQILAKERAQLEKEIKDLRKQYSKEITDLEWSERQKGLQLEQQMRELQQQKDRTAMERRFREENQQLGEIGVGFKQIFDEYDRAVFDAQVESQRKQFDLARQREELEKQVADYRYKIEEQTAKLREKIGDYEKKIEDYKTQQARRRSEEQRQAAMERLAIESGVNTIIMTPDDKERFLNAAYKHGVSAERTLAMLYAADNASGGNTIEERVANIANNSGLLLKASEQDFVKNIGMRSQVLGKNLPGEYILQQASATLGTGAFKRTSPAPPPKVSSLTDFITESGGYINRLRDALEANISKMADFFRQQFSAASEEAAASFKEKMMNPATWGLTRSVGSIREEMAANANATAINNRAGDGGLTKDILADGINNLIRMIGPVTEASDGRFNITKETLSSALNRTAKEGAIPKDIAAIFEDPSKNGFIKNLEQLKAVFAGLANAAKLFRNEIAPMSAALDLSTQTRVLSEMSKELKNNAELVRFRNRLMAEGFSSDQIEKETQIYQLRKKFNELESNATKLIDERIAKVKELQDLLNNPKITDEERKRLQDELNKAQDYIKTLEEEIKRLKEQLGKTEKDIRNTPKEDPVESLFSRWKTEIKDVRALIASLAQTVQSELASAMSAAITGVIDGTTTIGEAFGQMFKNIGKAFIDMATAIISKMLVMYLINTLLGGLFGGGSVSRGTPGAKAPNGKPYYGPAFAEGGFVTGPTRALIGEGGEPEYVIPASKMRSAMSRYSAGARGSNVIPGSSDGGDAGGTATMTSAPIDVRYSVERINNVDYVTADQFQAGMAQAAQQGAIQGERRALRTLQSSAATRKRIGV